jgi:hypothetical protein
MEDGRWKKIDGRREKEKAIGKSKKGKGKDNLSTMFYYNKVKRLYIFFSMILCVKK